MEENQEFSGFRDWLLPMLMNGQVPVGNGHKMVEDLLSLSPESQETSWYSLLSVNI
jgi:hypothetical protein